MVIFNSYVKLPEGTSLHQKWQWNLQKTSKKPRHFPLARLPRGIPCLIRSGNLRLIPKPFIKPSFGSKSEMNQPGVKHGMLYHCWLHLFSTLITVASHVANPTINHPTITWVFVRPIPNGRYLWHWVNATLSAKGSKVIPSSNSTVCYGN
jgi:hypothetical protein